MGLFSFLGKAVGKIAGTALGIIPGGGIAKSALGLAGALLSHKQPMGASRTKYSVATAYGIPTMRAQPRAPQISVFKKPMGGFAPPPATLRQSPVMPGGAVATSAGIMAPGGGLPPATYGGRHTGGKRTKRKSSSARRSSRARSGSKRKSGTRKLKFGSPAWRAKYMRRSSGKRRRGK